MAIKFTEQYEVQAAGGPIYRKGAVVRDLDQQSEEHFIRKGVAVRQTAQPKAKAKAKAKAKSKK